MTRVTASMVVAVERLLPGRTRRSGASYAFSAQVATAEFARDFELAFFSPKLASRSVLAYGITLPSATDSSHDS